MILHVPIKKRKEQPLLDSFERLLFSNVRQPIESLFNWSEEKIKLRIVRKVRPYNGLLVPVFERRAAAFFVLAILSSKYRLICDKKRSC